MALTRREALHHAGKGAAAAATLSMLPLDAFAATRDTAAMSGTITVWVWHNNEDQIHSVMPIWKKTYPNVTVKVEVLPFADLHNKLYTVLRTHSGGPDVSWVEIGQLAKFVTYGPRSGLVDFLQPPYNAGRYKAAFFPFAWNQCLSADKQHLMAMPRAIGAATLMYRRDLFKEAGLPTEPADVAKIIRTWDDYIAVGKKVTNPAKKRWLCYDAVGGSPWWLYFEYRFYDAQGNLLVGKDPEQARFLRVLQKIRGLGLDAKGIMGAGDPIGQAALKRGSIATNVSGSWMEGIIQGIAPELKGKWAQIPAPGFHGPQALEAGGDFCVVPAHSPNTALAWEFARFMTLDTKALAYIGRWDAAQFASIPYLSDPSLYQPDPYTDGQQVYRLVVDLARKMPIGTLNVHDPIAFAACATAVQKAVNEHMNVDQALAQARAQIVRETSI